jgi:hypothetical protein
VLVLRLLAYLLWIPALFAVIAAVVLPVVGSGLSRRSRVAASWPQRSCAEVRSWPRGPEPVHVHGACAPGPRGVLRGRLSGDECVWYRMRVLRRYLVKQIRYVGDEWTEVDVLVEDEIWAWDSGPFAVRDATGSVLVAPALLAHTLNAAGHPADKEVVDEVRDEGADARQYRSGKLGVLLADGILPEELLDRFAHPSNRTSGYRVQEDILRPGKPSTCSPCRVSWAASPSWRRATRTSGRSPPSRCRCRWPAAAGAPGHGRSGSAWPAWRCSPCRRCC